MDNRTIEYVSVVPEGKPTEPGVIHTLLSNFKTSVLATLMLAVIVSGAYPLIVWVFAQLLFSHAANGSLIESGKDKTVVGSEWIGQSFSAPEYFHSRPSAAGNGYDSTASGGSNLGPISSKFLYGDTKKDANNKDVVDNDGIELRVLHFCDDNNIEYDAFTSSADSSGKTVETPAKVKDDKGNLLDDVKLITMFNDASAPVTIRARSPIPVDAVTASGSGLDPHISRANADLQSKRVADARGVSVEQVKSLIDKNTDGASLGLFGEAGVNVLKLNLALNESFAMKPAPAAPSTAPSTAPSAAPATVPITPVTTPAAPIAPTTVPVTTATAPVADH